MLRSLYLLAVLSTMFATACAVDTPPADPGGYATQEAALKSKNCKVVCVACKPGKPCPASCHLVCGKPTTCVQTAMCVKGATWSPTQCKCVINAPVVGACSSNADCKLQANYCGGCFCDALGPNQKATTCVSTVKCFADPCLGHTAACVNGFCSKL